MNWVSIDKFDSKGNKFPDNPKEGHTHYDTVDDTGWIWINYDAILRCARKEDSTPREDDKHTWEEVMVRPKGWTEEKENEGMKEAMKNSAEYAMSLNLWEYSEE